MLVFSHNSKNLFDKYDDNVGVKSGIASKWLSTNSKATSGSESLTLSAGTK